MIGAVEEVSVPIGIAVTVISGLLGVILKSIGTVLRNQAAQATRLDHQAEALGALDAKLSTHMQLEEQGGSARDARALEVDRRLGSLDTAVVGMQKDLAVGNEKFATLTEKVSGVESKLDRVLERRARERNTTEGRA